MTTRSRAAANIVDVLGDICVYQFHDTSRSSGFNRFCEIENRTRLVGDGSNLAAILFRLKIESRRRYEFVCMQIARVLPGFDQFDIQEDNGKVALRWRSKTANKGYGAHLTSDGSLRLFALIALLNLPAHMLPTIVFLDEPELGLHPSAVTLIGGMIKALSASRQVIVATQSPELVDAFEIDEVAVIEADRGSSKVRMLQSSDYEDWLEEGFLPGQLWRRNLIGGLP